MSVAMWNCHFWPLDVSTGGECEIAILDHSDVSSNVKIAILDHYMSVAMWNCHSGPLDVSTGGIDLPADLGVDLPNLKPNLNSSWPVDASAGG